MAEGNFRQEGEVLDYVPDADITAGEVIQLRNGNAAVFPTAVDFDTAETGAGIVEGVVRLDKAANIVLPEGVRVFWDHSANKATYVAANDRDFYVGYCIADAAAADTYVDVMLNKQPVYNIDVSTQPFTTVATGTAVVGEAGFSGPKRYGSAHRLNISATSEVQKVDILSDYGFAAGANAFIEAEVNVISGLAAGGAQDFNIGVASATHGTDADSIAISAFCHIDGNSVNILAECDDGTNETAATDTTIDATAGTPFTVWIDMRDLASVKFYVNGARVLSGTTFSMAAATGNLFLLAHLEKTTGTETFDVKVNYLRARISQK
jgi:predicted RecA/RadA family phage recombinase